jgi:radical SAM superfamily enzyme YgiQ (UPF0313 family)
MDMVDEQLVPIAMDAHLECPPYGMYLLKAALHAAGHDAVLLDLIAAGTNSLAAYWDRLDDAELIGIGATSMSWSTALSVIRQIRARRTDVPIVLGGIHPTMFDRYLLSVFPVDFVIRGEGELGLTSLAATLEARGDLGTVPNLSWRDADGRVVRNPLNKLIAKQDLAMFPVPDYSTMPAGVYQALSIESSRGCAFDCSFCSTSYRRSYRAMEPEVFVDRLEQVLPHCALTKQGTIHIIDDEFSMNTRRATKIAQLIGQRGLDPGLVYDSRANDLLDEAYVEAIAPFTTQFLVGAECGYDEGLLRIGKGTTCAKLEAAAAMLQKYGIAERADFSFVLGLPWETYGEVERTISFATRLHALYGVRILLQWYCQIPGSRLWDAARKRGDVTEAMYDEFGFFSNLYLFRSGVNLTPEEIYRISSRVAGLLTLSSVQYPEMRMIEYSFPQPIATYFPQFLQSFQDTGLASLRQVARPHAPPVEEPIQILPNVADRMRVGVPLRHFEGVN